MKKYIFIFAGFMVSAFLVACGSDNKGGGTVISCPAGTVYQNGNCVNGNGAILNTGPVGFYSDNWSSNSFSPVGSGLRDFLKEAMGVCDRAHSSGGSADCSAWLAGAFDIVILSPTTQTSSVQVTFRAVPQNVNYYYSLPSAGQILGGMFGLPVFENAGAFQPVLTLNNMAVSVSNNYQGFEIRGYGILNSLANRSLIQIRVAQGKLEDAEFNYFLSYKGQDIATGRFIRCNTADCGLSRPLGY